VLGRLFLLFTIVPVVELYLLITIGGWLGAGPTVGIVLLTGLVGAWLAKQEGGRVLREWQGAVHRGEIPKEGVTSSLLVLVGGVLLVTPGVVTDVVGLALLFPPTRRKIAALVSRQVQKRFTVTTISASLGSVLDAGDGAPRDGEVIDLDAGDVLEKP
jgi:UPF0716 protein FxsA